jgi:hypothetical protein
VIRSQFIAFPLIAGIFALVVAPVARADDTVTYEVISSYVAAANVEYFDLGARKALESVPLPWRTNATVGSAHSNDAEVRADWRPAARPSKWVTVRIYFRGNLLCENTLDVGNSACYGSTPFKS